MILFLTSSPCIYKHSPATLTEANGFLARLRAALPKKPRTLFVASAPEDHGRTEYFAQDMANAFHRSGIGFRTARILDSRSEDQAKKWVEQSDLLILMGGHVPTQNAFFQKIGLRELLKDYPGVIMGISAGTMNAAEVVYAQPEADGESDPGFRRFYPGLGLTQINVCPHYQEVVEKNMTVDGIPIYPDITTADSRRGHTFHIFPDGTYIYKDEKEYAIYGECLRMTNGILEKLSGDGGRIDLDGQ